jgi:hypothetical protein
MTADDLENKVETKVNAAGIGAALAGVLMWVFTTYVFNGDVPDSFTLLINIVVPGVVAWVAGWLAPHTRR